MVDGESRHRAATIRQNLREIDAKVRAIFLEVSNVLSKATTGRAKISTLNLVPDAKNADIVISLSGKPEYYRNDFDADGNSVSTVKADLDSLRCRRLVIQPALDLPRPLVALSQAIVNLQG